jgi:serine/threonine protein kinase
MIKFSNYQSITKHTKTKNNEGGFSFVYLVKDISSGEEDSNTSHNNINITESITSSTDHHVLKITSIHSRQQRDIAEKEAKLLSRLSHPSIVRMLDSCYRSIPAPIPDEIQPRSGGGKQQLKYSSRPQHLILMEYCEGGTALSVCNRLKNSQKMFDIQSLIIAFGQICNAVSYLHAQRPPIVHRDLKPVNFLVKNGAYKLCDFGSAVFGHVDLRTSRARAEAEEVIEKTTTQMFRSPEMVDLYVSKKLTQR